VDFVTSFAFNYAPKYLYSKMYNLESPHYEPKKTLGSAPFAVLKSLLFGGTPNPKVKDINARNVVRHLL